MQGVIALELLPMLTTMVSVMPMIFVLASMTMSIRMVMAHLMGAIIVTLRALLAMMVMSVLLMTY